LLGLKQINLKDEVKLRFIIIFAPAIFIHCAHNLSSLGNGKTRKDFNQCNSTVFVNY
jgi:hypothetical protein